MSVSSRGRPGAEITITDVAARAGVSIRTVSRVLNDNPKVNGATRERVQGIIAALGFRPSLRARGLATGRSYLIGLVHNDRNALVLDTVQRGVVAQASARGYEVVIHPAPAQASGTVDDVVAFARRSRVDGVLIVSPVSGVPGIGDALAAAGVPAVATSSVPIEGFRAVLHSDERGAAADVARYLIDRGHRRLAIINGPAGAASADERRAGFVDAAFAAGIAAPLEAEGDYGFDSGYEAAERLLAATPVPTAIFAANDIMAAAVLKAATARGIAVPDALSVVGFDGSLVARMLTPALTTVERPLHEMARQTTLRLLDVIEGKDGDTALGAPLKIVEGGSTAPLPA